MDSSFFSFVFTWFIVLGMHFWFNMKRGKEYDFLSICLIKTSIFPESFFDSNSVDALLMLGGGLRPPSGADLEKKKAEIEKEEGFKEDKDKDKDEDGENDKNKDDFYDGNGNNILRRIEETNRDDDVMQKDSNLRVANNSTYCVWFICVYMHMGVSVCLSVYVYQFMGLSL